MVIKVWEVPTGIMIWGVPEIEIMILGIIINLIISNLRSSNLIIVGATTKTGDQKKVVVSVREREINQWYLSDMKIKVKDKLIMILLQ